MALKMGPSRLFFRNHLFMCLSMFLYGKVEARANLYMFGKEVRVIETKDPKTAAVNKDCVKKVQEKGKVETRANQYMFGKEVRVIKTKDPKKAAVNKDCVRKVEEKGKVEAKTDQYMFGKEFRVIKTKDPKTAAVNKDCVKKVEEKAFCEQYEGYLATIETSGENKFLKNYLKSNQVKKAAWIGGIYNVEERTWIWSHTREKITFTDWVPRRSLNTDGGKMCVKMERRKGYRWNYQRCNVQKYYVCEKRRFKDC